MILQAHVDRISLVLRVGAIGALLFVSTLCVRAAAAGDTNAVSLPAIRLAGRTNVISDNGTTITYNGSPIPLLSTVTPAWTQVTLDGTNAVCDIGGIATTDRNFYWATTTSNYITFSNLVAGAHGTIWINCSGTPQQINFSASYDNFSTNEIAPVFTVTNRAIIAFKVGPGTSDTNLMLAIKRK